MIRFGLLGCGRIAKRHSDLLGGNHINGARLAAVCDVVRSRADALAAKFAVPAHYDIDDFLASKEIDAVAVLTPSGMHPAHVIACANVGKHVIVEKPMALRLQDADEMIRACDRAGVKLFVVKQNRFNVPVVRARGALGIIEATTAARPTDLEGSLSILGEKGTVEIAGFAVNQIRHWRFVDELPSDKDVIEKFSVNPPNVYGFGHQAYYQHVIDCLVNQRAALVDGLEGRKSLELISALYESIETGHEVPLRFTPHRSRLGVVS